MDLNRVLNYARAHRAKFVFELKEFLRFPSVSSQPERRADLRRCAHWLARHLHTIGLERVHVIPTQGNPVVCASWLHARNQPTLLIYGHYDVVPGEPLARWLTPPFSPTIRENNVYGRGAADDKGQLFCHVKALESYLRTTRALPVNVKCLFEGEEEIGSTHLLPLIARNKKALRADAAVISDTRMLGPDGPAISYAQRGALRAELEVQGPSHELHSGTFGGAVLNPIQALCGIIADMHDESGRVTIPGFYDDVREWSREERNFMERSGPGDEKILRDGSLQHGWGESGYTLYERTTIRPALILNGITGGHQGVKGVIPTQAMAKLSFRLVPDQDPKKIACLFREYIAQKVVPGVEASARLFSPIRPAVIDRNHPAVRVASLAYEKSFGAPAVFLRSGGSIPVVSAFEQHLGIPTVLLGFGLPDDHIHAPNEKFSLSNFSRGIAASIWYMALAARALRPAARPAGISVQEDWLA